jgi:hypothetical protein
MPYNKDIDLSKFTPEERRERMKQQQKEWYKRNKERLREEYYQKNHKHSLQFYREFYEKYHNIIEHMEV